MTKKVSMLAVLVAVTVGIVWLAEMRNGFFDSKVYYGAIRFWFREGGMVYDWTRPGTPYGFTYPPFAGLTMAPMAVLPFGAVVVIATAATVLTTVLVVGWLILPLVRRRGWPVWFALGVAGCLAIAFEPVRETITFGQVNTLLLALVAGDLLFGVGRGRRWAGAGIGLATAVKLTPGVFILYLLVTRRWRAAFTAMAAAAGATLATAAIFPDQSWRFWTSALWDPGRVGDYWYLSNQSLRGFVARLPFDGVESYLWIAGAGVLLVIWYRRVRARADDLVLGLALTGVLGCLLSPITWVHHCVWLLPALIRCAEAGLTWPGRRGYLFLAGAAYLVMTSRLTWLWENTPRLPLALLGSNLYVYFSLALLIWTPASRAGDRQDCVGAGRS